MTQPPSDRSRPTPRPRPSAAPRAAGRPSPRPKVAGSRRDRDDAGPAAPLDGPGTPPTDTAPTGTAPTGTAPTDTAPTGTGRRSGAAAAPEHVAPVGERSAGNPRWVVAAAVLGALCLLAAAAVGVLAWLRQDPEHVDPTLLTATRSAVEDLYAYDYQDSDGSVERKLAVLTGELREQYETELSSGIIDTYEQVSATTSYEVLDVGLQQINDAQDTATVVVFGSYVAQSVTSGNAEAPEGSECQVTPEGAQSCVQTLQLRLVQVDGDWKISELTQLTQS